MKTGARAARKLDQWAARKVDRLSAVYLTFFSERRREESAVGMWESRGLCEISKLLWKSFCDFHRSAISIVVCLFVITSFRPAMGGCWTLAPLAIVVPTASYAVGSESDRSLRAERGVTARSAACACDSSCLWW